MVERIFEYGETFLVEVLSASPMIITVYAYEVNEGFMLTYHGMEVLPAPGDKGKIVFERDKGRGHWQYYPGEDLRKKLITNVMKASEIIANAEGKSKPTYHGASLITCTDADFIKVMKMDINILASSAQADIISERKKKLGIE